MSENTKVAAISRAELIHTLQNSLYPGAKPESCAMVLDYCQAANLNPMLKPVDFLYILQAALRALMARFAKEVSSHRRATTEGLMRSWALGRGWQGGAQ